MGEQEDATKNLCLNFVGSQPQELFNDVIERLENELSKDTETVGQIMQLTNLSFHVSSSTTTLKTALYDRMKYIIPESYSKDKAELEMLYKLLIMVPDKNLELIRSQILAKHRVKRENVN